MLQSLASRLNEPSTWAGVGGMGTLLIVLKFIAENGADGVALVAKLIPFVASGDYVGLAMAAIGFILAVVKREKGEAAVKEHPLYNFRGGRDGA